MNTSTVKTIAVELTETVGANVLSSTSANVSNVPETENVVASILAPTSTTVANASEVITNEHYFADDYNVLRNHPSINSVELIGNKTFEELGLSELSNTELETMLKL